MVQVINDPNRQSAGTAIGSALSTALQGLASHKISQMQAQKQQQRTAQGLQTLFNIPAQDAYGLAQLDPSILDQVVKQKLAEPGQQAYQSSLQALLGGETQPTQQQLAPVQSPAQELPAQQQEQEFHPNQVTQEQRDELAKFLRSPEAQQSLKAEDLKVLSDFATTPFSAQPKVPLIKGGLNEKQATELAKLGLEKQKMNEAKEERSEKRSLEHMKLNHEEIKDLRKQYKTAKQDLDSLDRLEELEKNGELNSETYNAALDGFGLDIAALRSPGSQEFNKIVNNFVRNVKDVFGARISNQEMEQFMLTLPNLSQSPEGRKRVIANLKKVARANLEYGKVTQEVLKEHKGLAPIDILEQVEERMDKRLDKISQQFKEDLKKPVPEASNKLGVALAYGAGSAARLGSAAALGGLVGSFIPGLGTAVGAGVGTALGQFGGSILRALSSKRE